MAASRSAPDPTTAGATVPVVAVASANDVVARTTEQAAIEPPRAGGAIPSRGRPAGAARGF